MRDLASRLREVVRREREAPARELTYVPDPDSHAGLLGTALRLGGIEIDDRGACVSVDYIYESHRSHGRRPVEWYAPNAEAPIRLFDPRIPADADWSRRVVFFDTETTGLSGGAGTLAFLAGCGWFDKRGFVVRQFFLAGPSGERALLAALGEILASASLLVTYNGRTFDVPLMETRWAFHRQPAATDDVLHFDMLPPARRLWGRRGQELNDEAESSCRLSALERTVLGFHRMGDVPGFEIPTRYFHFIRTGDVAAITGVLEHNRHDILSLAAVMSHAMWLAAEGPEACREPFEQIALGRLYETAEDGPRARRAYEMAAQTRDGAVRREALARLAHLLRREGEHDASAAAWQGVLELAPAARAGRLLPIERRAARALAIHHEHRARNPGVARGYATLLGTHEQDVRHRLDRLNRKIHAAEKAKDGCEAVPLLDDVP